METLGFKLRKIIIPVLFTVAGGMVLNTLLYLVIKKIIKPGSIDDIVFFFTPFCVLILCVILFTSRRIKLLKIKNRRTGNIDKSAWFSYAFIICMPFWLASVGMQGYAEKAMAAKASLNYISDIKKNEDARYFTIDHAWYDKERRYNYNVFRTSGKHDEDLNFYIYFITPIIDSAGAPRRSGCDAWLGTRYSKSISNNKYSDAEKDNIWQNFFKESVTDYKNADLSRFTYLETVTQSDDIKGFEKARLTDSAISDKSGPILQAVNKPFENRFDTDLDLIQWPCGIGLVLVLALVGFTPLKKAEETDPETTVVTGGEEIKNNLKDTLKGLKLHKGTAATQVLLYANAGMFIAMVFSGLGFLSFPAEALLKWGADYGPLTLGAHEYWRLVVSTFLHGGIMHIIGNAYGLLVIGVFLEPVLGSRNFALAYIATGICASLTSMYWHPQIVSVGASGAIFGMFGVFLTLIFTDVYPKAVRRSFLTMALIFVGFNLIYGLAGGVDNAAHVGGLISGLVLGFIITPIIKNRMDNRSKENVW